MQPPSSCSATDGSCSAWGLAGPRSNTRAAALARYRDAVWGLSWKYSDMESSATRPLPAASPPPFEGPDERLLRGTAHAGTTDELVDALLDIRRQAGVPVEFVARSHLPL